MRPAAASFVLLSAAVLAQNRPESLPRTFEIFRSFPYTLANAPVSNAERDEIYQAIDTKGVHESFTDQQRDKERKELLDSPVGPVALALDGSEQIFVREPQSFCGAANCGFFIFVREAGHARSVFDSFGTGLTVGPTSHKGFRDLSTSIHWSAFEREDREYQWNGSEYIETQCHRIVYPRPDEPGGNGPGAPTPAIADCPGDGPPVKILVQPQRLPGPGLK